MASAPLRLDIRLMGTPRILVDGQEPDLDTRKAVALLAYLTERQTDPSRDELAELLWPMSTADRSRAALRRTISTLRSGLGGRWVSADRDRVAFDREGTSIDTARLASGQLSTPELKAIGGRFLEGFYLRDAPEFEQWQLATAETYDRLLRAALTEEGRKAFAGGDAAAAAEWARKRLSIDSLDESAHRDLMRALAAAGDRAAATRQFRSCVRILDEDLGVAPLPETVALHEAILAGEVERLQQPARPETKPGTPASVPLHTRQRAALAEAGSVPGTVIVSGPSGSGRSHLVRAVFAEAVIVTPHAGEEGLPHSVTSALLTRLAEGGGRLDERAATAVHVAPALRRLVDEVPPVEGELGPMRLIDGIAAAIAALAGSSPIVVDDFDRADTASRQALEYLARRATDLGVRLILVTSEEGDGIQVGPLASEEMRELGRALGKSQVSVDQLMESTGGLVGPIVEVLTSPDPSGAVAELRERRIATLDATARQVLEALAVSGRQHGPLLASISGRTPEETASALDSLLAAGLISGGDGGYEIDKEWVQEFVDRRLGPGRRALLAGRAADSLADRRDLPALASRSDHLAVAGRTLEAAVAHAESGKAALAVHAHDAARQHLSSALAMGHPDPQIIHRLLGDVERAAGRYSEAIASYNAAAAIAPEAALEQAIGDVYRRWGRWTLALAAFEAAQRLASEEERVLLTAERALVAHQMGDQRAARELISEALAGIGGGSQAARVRNVAGMILDDVALLEEAVTLARTAGAREEEAAALNNLALALLRRNRPDDALGPAERALALLDRTGDRHRRAAVHGNLADIHHVLRDEVASRRHFRIAAELFSEVGVGPREWEPAIWMLTGW